MEQDQIMARVFESHPAPWGSGVVHDADGRPVKDGPYRLRQYFIDKNGNHVRNAAGRLIHLLVDDRGQPVFDEDGHSIFVEVEVGPEHLGSRGERLIKD
jgi:hypothetical protein